jgi:hypothetical protein
MLDEINKYTTQIILWTTLKYQTWNYISFTY